MVASRIGIMLIFMATVLFDDLRDMMDLVGIFIVVALLSVILQTDKSQTQTFRRQLILDLGLLLVVAPVAVLNGFVAAEPGALLPAEQSALLQTGGALLIVVALAIWAAMLLFPDDRSLAPAILLPGLVLTVSVNFVLHDYRNQTVLAMFAVSYFIGAAAIAIGALVDEPVRRHVPAAFYGATLLAGMVLFDPGLGNIFDRDGLVQMFAGLVILFGLAVLIVIPNPSLDEFRLSAGGRAMDRTRRQGRNTDDPSRDDSERSR